MSVVTKPIILDETGQAIVSALEEIKDVIENGGTGDNPVKIIIVTPPTKTEYSLLDTLDLSGIAVGAVFSNNSIIDVTDQCSFTPADGTVIKAADNITISWDWHATGKTFTTIQPISVNIPSWADGTDAEIAAMLESHYAGDIDIHDYWSVGDERTVTLGAMEALSPLDDAYASQDVTYVLMNEGGKNLVSAIGNISECAFIVGQKDTLYESENYNGGFMNSTDTNANGWEGCERRTWCNTTYRSAIPESFRSLFKLHQNKTGQGSTNYSSVTISEDYFALPSEKEVTGGVIAANATSEADNAQFEYYETSTNRIKLQGNDGNNPDVYFTRSPYDTKDAFVYINSEGSAIRNIAYLQKGMAPFGVI